MWQVLLLILLALVVVKFLKVYFFWHSKGIPYENFLRCLYRILFEMNVNPYFDVIRKAVKTNGRFYGSYRGTTPVLVASDIDIVKEVLIKQFGNFFTRSYEVKSGNPLWDNTILNLPYDHWKSVRTVMGYTFTSAKMRSMIPKLDKVAKRLMSKLEVIAKSNYNEVVLKPYLQNYGMDSMAAIAIGIELNCIDDPNSQFVKMAADIFKPGMLGMVLSMLIPTCLIKYIPFASFPPRQPSKFFSELVKHVLKEKSKKLDEVVENNTADIMDYHLIAMRDDPKSELTDDILASQAFIFFVGGLDNTVVTLEFVAYYLAINPKIQEEVYQDIKKVLGDRENVEYNDLQKLQLLEACTLESLRLLPSSFSVDRVCTKETVVAGVTIEEGMIIEFPSPFIHRDPVYFPDPDSFNPHRFLKGGEVSSEISAFLTFGDGPKNCAGRRIALMNISVLLVNILVKMKIERTEKTPVPMIVKNGVRMNDLSKDPIYIKLTPRKMLDDKI